MCWPSIGNQGTLHRAVETWFDQALGPAVGTASTYDYHDDDGVESATGLKPVRSGRCPVSQLPLFSPAREVDGLEHGRHGAQYPPTLE